MTEEQKNSIVYKLEDCINNGNIPAFIQVLNEDLSKEPVVNACLCISGAILKCHTFYKSDMLALFLEKAIHFNMNWAKFNGGKNPLFRVTFLTGSWDLYTCFIEEVEGLNEETYADAYAEWQDLNNKILDHAQMYIKGHDYNSGFETNGQRILDIEDYNLMNFIAENYNAIIGRHKILKDLETRL